MALSEEALLGEALDAVKQQRKYVTLALNSLERQNEQNASIPRKIKYVSEFVSLCDEIADSYKEDFFKEGSKEYKYVMNASRYAKQRMDEISKKNKYVQKSMNTIAVYDFELYNTFFQKK